MEAERFLEAGEGRRRQAMPWGSCLSTAINTVAHVVWLALSALLLLHYRHMDWLTSVYRRWKWRNIDYDKPMDPHVCGQLVRAHRPSFSQLKAQDKWIATECLKYYNDRHQGLTYVLASGDVTQFTATSCTGAWTHGNFVARPRKKGCFSFIYGPQTLFFFELIDSPCNGGIVTCTPLVEEVDETHSFLGLPLWWAKRRDGKSDCVCEACGVRNPSLLKTSPCEHKEVEPLCRMCFDQTGVMHPSPGEFLFGHQKDVKFSNLCSCF